MEWDTEENSKSSYIVEVNDTWFSLEEANKIGIKVNISDNNLKISVPQWINYNGGWIDTLNGKSVQVRLRSNVKDSIMQNKNIGFVENISYPEIDGLDWKINPNDTKDRVKILRQGGWATGTKPGELKIVKILSGSKIPIKDVEFTLKKSDGSDITVRQGDGQYINKGKKIVLKTNQEGIANIKGLEASSYVVTETKAPDWIEFSTTTPIKREFTVSNSDAEGKEYTVENKKKTTNIEVEKIWKDSNNKVIAAPQSIKVQLYRNGKAIKQPVDLSSHSARYRWENLEFSDDTGEKYNYTVKELDSNGNAVEQGDSIKIDQNWFKVGYGVNIQNGFVITNEKLKPWTPITPSIRDIKVTKEWKDDKGNNLDALIDKIQVELYRDGGTTGEKLDFTKDNNWTATFEKLPVSQTLGGKKHEYTIKEVGENGSKITFDGKTYNVEYAKNSHNSFIIKNTLIKPETVNITAQKTWSNGKEAKEIKIILMANGKYANKSQIASTSNKWRVEFNDLPKFDENKNEIKYTVSEITSGLDKPEGDNTIVLGNKKYEVNIIEKSKYNFVIDNKYIPEIPSIPKKKNLEVSKVSFSNDNKTVI